MRELGERRIFISHASADAEFARWLDGRLRAAGFSTWLDARELRVGDRLSRKLGRGIDEAAAVVAVFSPETADARWMWLELGSAINRMVTDERFKLLPALIADVELPGEIRDLVYADFRSDREVGLRSLVDALHDLMRDDWQYQYRTRKQEVEDAVARVLGPIVSSSILGGYGIPDMDLIQFQSDVVPDQIEIAFEIDPTEIDGFWMESFRSAMEHHQPRAALVVVDETPPAELFDQATDGLYVNQEIHVVHFEGGLTQEVAEERLHAARAAIEVHLAETQPTVDFWKRLRDEKEAGESRRNGD